MNPKRFELVDPAAVLLPEPHATVEEMTSLALASVDVPRMVQGSIEGDARRRWGGLFVAGTTIYSGAFEQSDDDRFGADVLLVAAKFNRTGSEIAGVGLRASVGTVSDGHFTAHPDVPWSVAQTTFYAAHFTEEHRN